MHTFFNGLHDPPRPRYDRLGDGRRAWELKGRATNLKRPFRQTAALVFAAWAAVSAAGCLRGNIPWRETREIPPHFFVREWLLGADRRAVPIEESFAEAADEDGPPLGEPHGARMSVQRAQVYLSDGRRRAFIKQYRDDVRFWPSPDGRRLAVQHVWRDGPLEIVDAERRVRPLPDAALAELAPTYNDYPLGFVQWDDGRHLIAASVHTPAKRGYPYVARWRVDVLTGDRELVADEMLLLSGHVADWRLIPLPPNPTPEQAEAILRPLAESGTEWIRKTAQEYLRDVRRLKEGRE